MISVGKKRYAFAGIDMIVLLFAGLLYGWSIFVTPLETEFGWVRSQTSMAFALGTISNTIGAVFGATLAKKIGSTWVVRISSVICCGGFLLASNLTELWQLYLFYSVMCAGAIGMVYNMVLGTIVDWFQGKSSLITGMMLMCYGTGGLIFGTLASFTIQIIGWRKTFALLGIIAFVLMFGASFIIRKPKNEEIKNLSKAVEKKVIITDSEMQELGPLGMMKSKSFWLFFFWNIALASIGLTISGHASPMAQEVGITSVTAALFAGTVSLFNGIGRVLFGITFDKYGRKKSLIIVNATAGIGAIGLTISYITGNSIIMLLGFVFLGLGFGGAPISSAGFVRSLYGKDNYGVNVAIMNLSVVVASFLGPYISGVIFQSFGYLAVAILLCVLAALSLLIGIILFKLKILVKGRV
ncbi:MAG: MFS transporter [Suipraeoptans sp.]